MAVLGYQQLTNLLWNDCTVALQFPSVSHLCLQLLTIQLTPAKPSQSLTVLPSWCTPTKLNGGCSDYKSLRLRCHLRTSVLGGCICFNLETYICRETSRILLSTLALKSEYSNRSLINSAVSVLNYWCWRVVTTFISHLYWFTLPSEDASHLYWFTLVSEDASQACNGVGSSHRVVT